MSRSGEKLLESLKSEPELILHLPAKFMRDAWEGKVPGVRGSVVKPGVLYTTITGIVLDEDGEVVKLHLACGEKAILSRESKDPFFCYRGEWYLQEVMFPVW